MKFLIIMMMVFLTSTTTVYAGQTLKLVCYGMGLIKNSTYPNGQRGMMFKVSINKKSKKMNVFLANDNKSPLTYALVKSYSKFSISPGQSSEAPIEIMSAGVPGSDGTRKVMFDSTFLDPYAGTATFALQEPDLNIGVSLDQGEKMDCESNLDVVGWANKCF